MLLAVDADLTAYLRGQILLMLFETAPDSVSHCAIAVLIPLTLHHEVKLLTGQPHQVRNAPGRLRLSTLRPSVRRI